MGAGRWALGAQLDGLPDTSRLSVAFEWLCNNCNTDVSRMIGFLVVGMIDRVGGSVEEAAAV